MLRHPLKVGFSFGLTSGTITTLGLMVGLHSGTHSKLAVIGGVFTIAIADAFSDALGIHISEEAENKHSNKEIWEATIATFVTKFVFALSFVIPVFLFELNNAVIVSAIYGLLLICIFSLSIAKEQHENPWRVIGEHLIITLVVIVITHYVGDLIGKTFG